MVWYSWSRTRGLALVVSYPPVLMVLYSWLVLVVFVLVVSWSCTRARGLVVVVSYPYSWFHTSGLVPVLVVL